MTVTTTARLQRAAVTWVGAELPRTRDVDAVERDGVCGAAAAGESMADAGSAEEQLVDAWRVSAGADLRDTADASAICVPDDRVDQR